MKRKYNSLYYMNGFTAYLEIYRIIYGVNILQYIEKGIRNLHTFANARDNILTNI
jgi:hypothetical protein